MQSNFIHFQITGWPKSPPQYFGRVFGVSRGTKKSIDTLPKLDIQFILARKILSSIKPFIQWTEIINYVKDSGVIYQCSNSSLYKMIKNKLKGKLKYNEYKNGWIDNCYHETSIKWFPLCKQ